jgi:hypothetical protein
MITPIKVVGPSASADLTEYRVRGGNQGRGLAQRSGTTMANVPHNFKRFNAATLKVIEALGGDLRLCRDRLIEFERIERRARA